MTIDTATAHFARHVGIRSSYLDEFQAACSRASTSLENPAKCCLPPVMRYGEIRHETPLFLKGQDETLVLIAQRIRWFMGCHITRARIQSPILHIRGGTHEIIDHGYGRTIDLADLQRLPFASLRKRVPILEDAR